MPPHMLLYRECAARYGWTQDQVDDQDADYLDWLMLIETAVADADRIRSKPAPDPSFGAGPGGFGGGG